jgi:hypothetical protein
LEFLDDVCSDMSVFHGVRDITTLDGPTFFKLAFRLPAYQGAVLVTLKGVASELQEEAEEKKGPGTMTLEELQAAIPPAPSIGQMVPAFEVVKAR